MRFRWPTVLASTGITTAERLDGIDLTPYLAGENPERPEDKPILSEIWSHVMPNPAVALQFSGPDGKPYMYTYNAGDTRDELYDVDASSVELENLADRPGFRDLRETGINRLEDALSGDIRWRSYLNFIRLEYAEYFGHRRFDRQHFLGGEMVE